MQTNTRRKQNLISCRADSTLKGLNTSRSVIQTKRSGFGSRATTDTRRRSSMNSNSLSSRMRSRQPAPQPPTGYSRRKPAETNAPKIEFAKLLNSLSNAQSIQAVLHPRPAHVVYDHSRWCVRKLTPLSKAVSRILSKHVHRCKNQKCTNSLHQLHFDEKTWKVVTRLALENAPSFAKWKAEHPGFQIFEIPQLSNTATQLQSGNVNTTTKTLVHKEHNLANKGSDSSAEESDDNNDEESESQTELTPPTSSCFLSKKTLNRRTQQHTEVSYRNIRPSDYKRAGKGRLHLQLLGSDGTTGCFPLFAEDRLGIIRRYQTFGNTTTCEDFDTDEETVAANIIKTARSLREVFSRRGLTNH